MAWTDQEAALAKVKELYGRSGFTEDYGDYKRVGYLRGADVISATGGTWENAIGNLERAR